MIYSMLSGESTVSALRSSYAQKPLDCIGSSRVATRRVNQQSQIAGIDRLEPEKIKGQFSCARVMHRFLSFRHVEHIVTGP